jgi:hypothetical protein
MSFNIARIQVVRMKFTCMKWTIALAVRRAKLAKLTEPFQSVLKGMLYVFER